MKYYLICLLLFVAACKQKANVNDAQVRIASIGGKGGLTQFPDYDPAYSPAEDIPKDSLFHLSQDYPDTYDSTMTYPWEAFDFATQAEEYGFAVLAYCLEGNVEIDFKVQDNPIRPWYHAPWLHSDGNTSSFTKEVGNGNGREYLHGLTRERSAPPYELHIHQSKKLKNWAVGFYNEPGGYTIGRVWPSADLPPNPSLSDFPRGTVSFKLLFTNGDTSQVPFLENTKIWTANIYERDPGSACEKIERKDTPVSLLQIDIAVKDLRAPLTNWVFGTFIYDASKEGGTVWDRMQFVGLSWGDDSEVLKDLNRDGAFVNEALTETVLNPDLVYDQEKNYPPEKAFMLYHGLGARLNGPVDNPISSCVSCHSQAANIYKDSVIGKHMELANFNLNRHYYPIEEFQKWFEPVKAGAYFRSFEGEEYMTTDYSLQLSVGIRNYYKYIHQTEGSHINLEPSSVFPRIQR